LFQIGLNTDKGMDCIVLTNNNGVKIKVVPFGATLVSLQIPLKNTESVDVVLGFDDIESYVKSFESEGSPFFGATVGRYAGRIDNGVFELNGKQYQLSQNNGSNSLHGGVNNFSRKVWDIKNEKMGKNPSVTLSCLSVSGEENYPGDLYVEVTYTLSENNEVIIEYVATTTQDTVINLTHHSYFNLDGHKGTVANQELIVNSQNRLEVREDSIPTGKYVPVKNTYFDFRLPKVCPIQIDNTFVIDNSEEVVASLRSTKNNLKMDVYTNQPGVHIYVGGKFPEGLNGKENTEYHSQSGICFETQNFPDAPNHKGFPNSILRVGERYCQKTMYKFQTF